MFCGKNDMKLRNKNIVDWRLVELNIKIQALNFDKKESYEYLKSRGDFNN